MRTWLVSLLVALTCAGAVAAPAGARSSDRTRTVAARDALEAQVLAQVNQVRAQHGLAPLRLARGLTAAADAHSRDMAKRGYFDHDGPGGWTFNKRMNRWYPQGSHRQWSAGENLLWYSPDVDAAEAVKMWMQSPGHRRNILFPQWREIGLSAIHVDSAPGDFEDLEVTILTADFGVRK